jgi:FMN phosphatase YigB (HAD superfamily)
MSSPQQPIRAIAFDVYDTLAHWPQARVQPIEVQRLLGRFGVDISYQAFEGARQAAFYFDCPKREITGWTDFLALVFHRMGLSISLDLIAGVAAMYESRNDMELFPDAVPAMESARAAGLITCAFTTLPKFMLGRRGHEILSRLDHYFDASALGLPKGDRRFYERITQRLGIAPAEILAVGDDPICDVELPKEAGWRAVLLTREPKPSIRTLKTIATLADLPTCESF